MTHPKKSSLRIVFIGAGSIGFPRKLVADLLTVPEFANVELSFTDINKLNLDMAGEMLVAQAEWLPQYKQTIKEATARSPKRPFSLPGVPGARNRRCLRRVLLLQCAAHHAANHS